MKMKLEKCELDRINLKKGHELRLFLFSILILISSLESRTVDTLITLFEKQQFKVVCQEGMAKFHKGNLDEDFLGMVGVACAKIDYINPLGVLQKSLKSTKNGRINAVYFSTLVLQKKLIYHFMLDDEDLTYMRLPETDHVLSAIFTNLSIGKYEVTKKEPKTVEFSNGDLSYKLTLSKEDQPNKVLVDVFKNGKKIAHHWYR
jgi:hypothetical protein